jgi:hypothetical protein
MVSKSVRVRVALVLRGRFRHFLDHGAETGEHAITCCPLYARTET